MFVVPFVATVIGFPVTKLCIKQMDYFSHEPNGNTWHEVALKELLVFIPHTKVGCIVVDCIMYG